MQIVVSYRPIFVKEFYLHPCLSWQEAVSVRDNRSRSGKGLASSKPEKFKSSSQSSRFRSKHRVYSVTVRRLAAANLHHFVVDIFEHHKQFPEIATEGFAARLISLYGQAGMFTDARKLFDELPQLKCPRTVKSINAVLTAALDLS
ncbi:hypothetical protein ACLOJK_002752 [Asimina triloba]